MPQGGSGDLPQNWDRNQEYLDPLNNALASVARSIGKPEPDIGEVSRVWAEQYRKTAGNPRETAARVAAAVLFGDPDRFNDRSPSGVDGVWAEYTPSGHIVGSYLQDPRHPGAPLSYDRVVQGVLRIMDDEGGTTLRTGVRRRPTDVSEVQMPALPASFLAPTHGLPAGRVESEREATRGREIVQDFGIG